MTLANLLTSFRIALIPVYAVATWRWLDGFAASTEVSWRWIAFGLFLFISVTDLLDGALARWLDQRTVTGAWLDPTADKLLMCVSLILLGGVKIPMWFLAVWYVREVVMMVGVMLMHTKINWIDMKPRPISKLATFLQFLVVGAAFLWIPAQAVFWLTVVTAVVTVGSGLLYMREGIRQVYGHERERRRI